MITRAYRLRRLVWIVMLGGTSLGAQEQRRVPSEMAQIVDAAMQGVVPAEKMLGSLSVSERGVKFDYDRSTTAFGRQISSRATELVSLRAAVVGSGSAHLFSDCSQSGMKPCTLLGKSVYVSVEPIEINDTAAFVWVNVVYAQTMSSGRSFQSSSATKVYLSRSGSKPWRFVRVEMAIVS